jgi:hypothetical protein
MSSLQQCTPATGTEQVISSPEEYAMAQFVSVVLKDTETFRGKNCCIILFKHLKSDKTKSKSKIIDPDFFKNKLSPFKFFTILIYIHPRNTKSNNHCGNNHCQNYGHYYYE